MYKKEIDFKAGTHGLEEVLFDVEKTRLVTSDPFKDFDNIQVEKYVAIINTTNRKVLSIVSSKYHLLSNREAYQLGKQAFVQLFPGISEEDLVPFKVISPATKTFCHIDLIHKGINFDVWEQETWFPFVRITNSYNRTFALSLELGFVRKLCSNGVIFDKQTIKVKYNHTKGVIPVNIDSDVEQLRKLEGEFKQYLYNLKRFYVGRKYGLAMVCKALKLEWKIDPESPAYEKQVEQFERFKSISNELIKDYMDTDGENAFAIMNVLTDLVSHQDTYANIPKYTMRANLLYKRISDWMSEYCNEAEKRDFRIDNYLKESSRRLAECNDLAAPLRPLLPILDNQ